MSTILQKIIKKNYSRSGKNPISNADVTKKSGRTGG